MARTKRGTLRPHDLALSILRRKNEDGEFLPVTALEIDNTTGKIGKSSQCVWYLNKYEGHKIETIKIGKDIKYQYISGSEINPSFEKQMALEEKKKSSTAAKALERFNKKNEIKKQKIEGNIEVFPETKTEILIEEKNIDDETVNDDTFQIINDNEMDFIAA